MKMVSLFLFPSFSLPFLTFLPLFLAIMPLYLEGKLNASEYALMGAMKTFAYYFMAHQDEVH